MRVRYGIGLAVALAACSGVEPSTTSQSPSTTPAGVPFHDARYRVLYSLKGGPADGKWPDGPLVISGGEIYGAAREAGAAHKGAIYAIDAAGNERVVYAFGSRPNDGSQPLSLTVGDGILYGTTFGGGAAHRGTVFALTTSGQERVLHAFGRPGDGAQPLGVVVGEKTLYGVTATGGKYGGGTVFAVGENGGERILHNFQGGSDGWTPSSQPIAVGGVIYGTTNTGGNDNACYRQGCGTVFAVTKAGTETVLHAFGGAPDDGQYPDAIASYRGKLFGVTIGGGANNTGIMYTLDFAEGERLVCNFANAGYGYYPTGLAIASHKIFVTMGFGDVEGTILQVSPRGAISVRHRFADDRRDGGVPSGGFAGGAGVLYGATIYGGTLNRGTVYALTP